MFYIRFYASNKKIIFLLKTPMARFSDLPQELKDEIWQLTLRSPRIIQVKYCSRDRSFFFYGISPPVALHVCSDSRQQALLVYKQLLAVDEDEQLRQTPVYLYFAIDIVYLLLAA